MFGELKLLEKVAPREPTTRLGYTDLTSGLGARKHMVRRRFRPRVALAALVSGVLAAVAPSAAVHEPGGIRGGGIRGGGVRGDGDWGAASDAHAPNDISGGGPATRGGTGADGRTGATAENDPATVPARTRHANGELESQPSYAYFVKPRAPTNQPRHAETQSQGEGEVADEMYEQDQGPERGQGQGQGQGHDHDHDQIHQDRRRLAACYYTVYYTSYYTYQTSTTYAYSCGKGDTCYGVSYSTAQGSQQSSYQASDTCTSPPTSKPTEQPIPAPTKLPNPSPTPLPMPVPTLAPSTPVPSRLPIAMPTPLPSPAPSPVPTTVCDKGQYLDAESGQCEDCGIGKFQNTTEPPWTCR